MDRLGNIAITFKQIADPYGVYKLAKAELDNNIRIRRGNRKEGEQSY